MVSSCAGGRRIRSCFMRAEGSDSERAVVKSVARPVIQIPCALALQLTLTLPGTGYASPISL